MDTSSPPRSSLPRTLLLLAAWGAIAAGLWLAVRPYLGRLSKPVPAGQAISAAELAQPLPVDPAVIVRQLPNGFRYYLRANAQPRQRAELRLVVNAGSVLEEDDQRGLAHFVEHMAFNGTRHFPKQAITSFLQSVGMRFGPSINASTAYDETVYSLQVPTDSPAVLDRALLILEDWSHAVTFDPVEVDKERGVIVEEWRMRRGAAARLHDRQFPLLLADSRYAARQPIGDIDIIQHFKIDRLKQFYADWYRPDLLALVAVGDFDPVQLEERVRAHFGPLEMPPAPKPRPVFTVPAKPGTTVSIATDQETQGVSVAVYHRGPAPRPATIGDYRLNVLNQLAGALISARLAEAVQAPGSPLAGAGASRGLLVRPLEITTLQASVRAETVDRGLLALFSEFERITRFGFTAVELDRQKAVLLRGLEVGLAEERNRPSSMLASEYVRHITTGEPFPGLSAEGDWTKRFLPTFVLDDVNAIARAWSPDDNRVVLITAPEKAGVAVPTELQVRSALRGAQMAPLVPYVSPPALGSLLPREPASGRVTATREYPAIGVTEWTLSNGARVVLKPTTFKEDEVVFGAVSPGGTSLAGDTDFVPAETAAQVVASVGVGTFASGDLRRLLAGKAVTVRPVVGPYDVGLSGGAAGADLPTMFELIHLYMTDPRRAPDTFEALRTQMRSSVANQTATPEFAFGSAIAEAMSQGSVRGRPMTRERIDEMNLDASLAFYKARFGDAGNFTFAFVGSFSLDAIRPLVEKYLASLPATPNHDTWKDVGPEAPSGVVEKRVEKGLDSKGRTAAIFTAAMPFDETRAAAVRAAADILEERLRESLREELGGTYNVSVDGALRRVPRGESSVSIAFGSDPARADALFGRVLAEIARLQKSGPAPRELSNEKTALAREHETNLRQNGYWLSELLERYQRAEAPETLLQAPDLARDLSAAAVQEAAKLALDTRRYVRVTLAPERR